MKLLDLFSGIGGFHKGFEQAGFKFDWVGHSDIDKYANKLYQDRFKAEELGDVTTIQPGRLPNDITILCGGFPCQAFSIAGKRKGFDDTRGTLFFEIARILRYFKDIGKPIPYFVLENVKGLLNHEGGRTFATIYRVLADLDYTVECQLLNTKWFLPQNRERIYIVGHLRGRSGGKILPITESNGKIDDLQGQSVNTITSRYTGEGNGSYIIESEQYAQKGLNQIGNIDTKGHNSIWGRVYSTEGLSATINSKGGGMGAKTGLYEIKRVGGAYGQSIRWGVYDESGISPTLTKAMGDGGGHVPILKSSIRRLTPLECERLQGFPDNWTNNGQSDAQRYKQLGNAVSVPVVQVIAEKIKKLIYDKITF
tara:strand:+ start:68 stop:1168 length:1101 start_codon:yes stop_codon:yes gene_type:complete